MEYQFYLAFPASDVTVGTNHAVLVFEPVALLNIDAGEWVSECVCVCVCVSLFWFLSH